MLNLNYLYPATTQTPPKCNRKFHVSNQKAICNSGQFFHLNRPFVLLSIHIFLYTMIKFSPASKIPIPPYPVEPNNKPPCNTHTIHSTNEIFAICIFIPDHHGSPSRLLPNTPRPDHHGYDRTPSHVIKDEQTGKQEREEKIETGQTKWQQWARKRRNSWTRTGLFQKSIVHSIWTPTTDANPQENKDRNCVDTHNKCSRRISRTGSVL